MNITGFNERLQGRDYSLQYLDGEKLKNDRFYRITIFSKDLVSGSYCDGTYFVDLPTDINSHKYHLAIENMVVYPSSTSATVSPFMVELLDINQADTYNTSTKTNSRIALSTCLEGNIYWNGTAAVSRNWCNYQRNITASTIGFPLMDTNIMRSKQLRIQLKALDDTVLTTSVMGTSTAWVLTLLIYPFSS